MLSRPRKVFAASPPVGRSLEATAAGSALHTQGRTRDRQAWNGIGSLRRVLLSARMEPKKVQAPDLRNWICSVKIPG